MHALKLTFNLFCKTAVQIAWHKNRDEIGACAKFQFRIPSKFRACADFVAIFVPSNLQSSVLSMREHTTKCAIFGGELTHLYA